MKRCGNFTLMVEPGANSCSKSRSQLAVEVFSDYQLVQQEPENLHRNPVRV
jgi:hypothetical protein